MGIGGVIAGGWFAGLGVTTICGSAVTDSFEDKIERFTKWNIR